MIVARLKGYSGSRVELLQENGRTFVRKTGNCQRNYSRLSALAERGYPVCQVLDTGDNYLDIEYIHGLDMLNYLQRYNINDLIDFLCDVITAFAETGHDRDYTDIFQAKFSEIDFTELPFDQDQLLTKLDSIQPQSDYHGDLTLENIIYSRTRGFVLIDAVDIAYDGYRFDLAKLAQDLVAKWFLRNTQINLDYKLQTLTAALDDRFGITSNELIISQLLRVYRHAQNDLPTRNFLIERMRKLWKS